jgi:predicted Na+-dependent transporter
LAGASHWRLHIVVLASTFVLFPALGLGAKALFPGLLTPPIAATSRPHFAPRPRPTFWAWD